MPATLTLAIAALLLLAPPAPGGIWHARDADGTGPSAAPRWRLPVQAPLARRFDLGTNPFAGGQHRGVDLRAPAGTPVRAPCSGRVVVADRIASSGGVVTVLCGRWRVSHMPLATMAVRTGTTIAAGTTLGTVGRGDGHAGLHLGIRRDGARFGYVDPLRFLAPVRTVPPPLLGRPPRPRRTLPSPPLAPAPITQDHRSPAPARPAPLPSPAARPGSRPAADERASGNPAPAGAARLAPWPAWVGLALVLAGVGTRWRGTRRNRTRRPAGAVVRLNE